MSTPLRTHLSTTAASLAAEISAAIPRQLGHTVEVDIADDQDRSHALIVPPAGTTNSRRARDADKMAKASIIVAVPPAAAGPN